MVWLGYKGFWRAFNMRRTRGNFPVNAQDEKHRINDRQSLFGGLIQPLPAERARRAFMALETGIVAAAQRAAIIAAAPAMTAPTVLLSRPTAFGVENSPRAHCASST